MVRTEPIGLPLRTIANSRTTWPSTVAASTQARSATASTAVEWRVASLEFSGNEMKRRCPKDEERREIKKNERTK